MNRRDFLAGSTATLTLNTIPAAASSGTISAESGTQDRSPESGGSIRKRPNIVFFMPDEMRADSLACYGNPTTKTPNIDRLAGMGARFENCHVQFPVCGASRCSMLTGWPTSVRGHRSLFYFLRPEEPNMFRYLRQAGYDVFWFGKNDALATQSFADSVTQWMSPGEGRAGSGGAAADRARSTYSFLSPAGGDRRSGADYEVVQAAIKILERRESDRPFCLYLPMSNPHPPYTAPADFYNMYSPRDVPPPLPRDLPNRPSFHAGIHKMYGLDKLSETDFRTIRAVYYGKVSYSDWMLGELLEAVEKTGHNKDTAVFLMSDHGDYTGDYGLVEKWPSGLEDCLTHVPLLASVPGGKPGVESADMVELYDIMQTCLELAGIKANHTHFSRSLLPQIAGGKGDADRAAFAEGGYNVYEPQCFEPLAITSGIYLAKVRLQNEQPQTVSRSAMVRTRDHKLIMRSQGQKELYSYKEDPDELNNLYGEASSSAIQAELKEKLLDHYMNTTGIAPKDKDPRGSPPFYPTTLAFETIDWNRTILDE